MKNVLAAVLFVVGISLTTSCQPDSIAEQEEYEFQASDKDGAGSIGNRDGEDEDEDYN